jgi:hypothetical protein
MSNCSAISWQLFSYIMAIVQLYHGNCSAISWQLFSYIMVIVQLYHGNCSAISWQLFSYIMAITSYEQLFSYIMAIVQLYHGNYKLWAIVQLYHCNYKLHSCRWWCPLCTRSLKHPSLHSWHMILILSQPVIVLTLYCCMLY